MHARARARAGDRHFDIVSSAITLSQLVRARASRACAPATSRVATARCIAD